jgi:branched-chain amino acid aminotransferase
MIYKGFNNGKITDLDEITISVDNLAMGRAYAVYEFFRINNGIPFYLERHLDRFFRSLQILHFEIAYNRTELQDIVKQLININQCRNFFIRMYAIPDYMGMKSPSKLFLLPQEMPGFPEEHYQIGSVLLMREYTRFLPDAKSTNYIASVFWKPEMDAIGAIDVLFFNNGHILESSRGNIFIVKNGNVFTPGENILKGITRSIVLDLMKEIKIPYSVEKISMENLFNADEVFITSTTKLVMPIVKIEDRIIDGGSPGKVSKLILKAYQNLLNGNQ